MKKLIVKNFEQKIILHCEMLGQISDGQWENSKPNNHYEVWSDLSWENTEVASDSSSPLGMNFHLRRGAGYNFANRELLEIVGDRLLLKINLWKQATGVVRDNIEEVLGEDHWSIPDELNDARFLENASPHYIKNIAELKEKGISLAMLRAAAKGDYNRTDLVRDCKNLRETIKLQLPSEPVVPVRVAQPSDAMKKTLEQQGSTLIEVRPLNDHEGDTHLSKVVLKRSDQSHPWVATHWNESCGGGFYLGEYCKTIEQAVERFSKMD